MVWDISAKWQLTTLIWYHFELPDPPYVNSKRDNFFRDRERDRDIFFRDRDRDIFFETETSKNDLETVSRRDSCLETYIPAYEAMTSFRFKLSI